ncbi:hypothetical protein ECW26_27030 [Escherichia coli W26]|nr:hypothetical protein ECW26_27030 [Escherichia coli W26]EZJ22568.1 hypothetical protein AD39_1580 [Escherichia coli 1-182-04_S4_C3]
MLSVDSPFGFMVCKKPLIYQDDQPPATGTTSAIPERESV